MQINPWWCIATVTLLANNADAIKQHSWVSWQNKIELVCCIVNFRTVKPNALSNCITLYVVSTTGFVHSWNSIQFSSKLFISSKFAFALQVVRIFEQVDWLKVGVNSWIVHCITRLCGFRSVKTCRVPWSLMSVYHLALRIRPLLNKDVKLNVP